MNNTPEKKMLCPACLQENEEGADFCVKCGVPIGKYTGWDPIKSIYMMGWIYRALVSHPVPRYAATAISLIISTGIFYYVFVTVHGGPGKGATYLRDALLLFLAVVNLLFLWRVWANYAAHYRRMVKKDQAGADTE